MTHGRPDWAFAYAMKGYRGCWTCWLPVGLLSRTTVRLRAEKFGRTFANEIRRRSSGRLGDKWHLDEADVSLRGKKHWLWRAVDQDGFVLEVLVQSRRNAKAAQRLMRKLLKGQGRSPGVMITDKLRSYGAAKREIMPAVEHRSHKGLNNRAENSHQPVRRRARIIKRFKSQRHLPRSSPSMIDHQPVSNPAPRHLLRPPSRTANGGDEPVDENYPSMREICGWRLSLALPLLIDDALIIPPHRPPPRCGRRLRDRRHAGGRRRKACPDRAAPADAGRATRP